MLSGITEAMIKIAPMKNAQVIFASSEKKGIEKMPINADLTRMLITWNTLPALPIYVLGMLLKRYVTLSTLVPALVIPIKKEKKKNRTRLFVNETKSKPATVTHIIITIAFTGEVFLKRLRIPTPAIKAPIA